MDLRSETFDDGDALPEYVALGVPDPEAHMRFGPNRNPHLAWRDAPEGTRSFAIVIHDGDVPSRGDDVNQEGRTVPPDLPRVDFFHWVFVDIPPDLDEIREGSYSDGVVAGGKDGEGPLGRQGLNDYTGWFAGDPEMGGDYFGYDGPCPPWNDSIVHNYVFTVYALDTDRLGVEGRFTGGDVREAINGHVLDQAQIVGRYSLNPDVPA